MGEQNSESELKALQGPAILSGQLSRENTMRDVLEMVLQCREVEFGLFRILSKELRGYFGISFARKILGAHTTSGREYGIPALRQLLEAKSGMFIFAQLKGFPVEIKQSLDIPLDQLLEWRPEGVPPNMVIQLSQALGPWEQAQKKMETSEAADALRQGSTPRVNAAEEEADFNALWGKKSTEEISGASSLNAILPNPEKKGKGKHPLSVTVEILQTDIPQQEPEPPQLPPSDGTVKEDVASSWMPQPVTDSSFVPGPAYAPQPGRQSHQNLQQQRQSNQNLQQQRQSNQNLQQRQSNQNLPAQSQQPAQGAPQEVAQDASGGWSYNDLKEIGKPFAVTEEIVKPTGLAHSGRYKASEGDDPLTRTGKFMRAEEDESKESKSARQKMELSASGKFIAADFMKDADFVPGGNIDPRSAMQARPPKKGIEPIPALLFVISLALFGYMGYQIYSYMSAKVENPVNVAIEDIRSGSSTEAIAKLNQVVANDPKNTAAQLAIAVALVEQKKWDEVIAKCDEIISSTPSETEASKLRALAKSQKEDFAGAIADANAYLDAAKGEPPLARAEALSIRAYAEMKLNKYEDSINSYSKAIELDKNNMHLFASRSAVRGMHKKK